MRNHDTRAPGATAPARFAGGLLALGLLLTCAPAGAQSGKGDYIGTWSASGSLGYAIPNTDEFGNAATWRLAAGFSPTPQFEVDLELGRFSSSVSQPDAGGLPAHTIASGRLTVRPVCLSLQYHKPLPEMLSTVNVLAGVGYYFIDYAMSDEARDALAAAGAPTGAGQSVDNAWGFHLGAGLEYALTERLSLVGEGRYVFLSPQARGTSGANTGFEGSIDLHTWIFSAGVKVAF